jgi:signal transduction histidine kinase
MLDSIFEPLVHEGQTASHELSSGLGLGLFIVREIVRAHGGEVQVSSSEAAGTTFFTVHLPRSSDGSANIEKAPSAAKAPKKWNGDKPP